MKEFTTIIRAVDSTDGQIKSWSGPRIKAKNWNEAERYCKKNLGYCKVDGEFIEEIDFKTTDWINLN